MEDDDFDLKFQQLAVTIASHANRNQRSSQSCVVGELNSDYGYLVSVACFKKELIEKVFD